MNFAFLHITHGIEIVLFYHFTYLGFGNYIRVLQGYRTNKGCVCVCKEIYYKGFVHVIIEAKKFQDLQLATGDPDMYVVLTQVQRPENQN